MLTTAHDARVPNLFVIGVPKAGTTSLLRWLSDHPEVGKSNQNEPRFLMDRSDPLCRPDSYHSEGLAGYARFYDEAVLAERTRYLIDVSPQYYYQETAMTVIGQIAEAKVIMILRKPSARIYSLFNYSKNNKAALGTDMGFPEFIDEVRREGDSDVLRNRPMLCYAIKHSQYADYIRRWQSIVGRERLKIYLFEDLVRDPSAVLHTVAGDLGISSSFYADYRFPAQNESLALRHHGFHRLVHRSRRKLPRWLRRSLKPAYLSLNTRKPDRTMSDSDRRVIELLDDEFRDSEQELASLLGYDGPIWSPSRAPSPASSPAS